ncbi:hypothetical protein PV939_10385, partial [Ligilactobacillus salivarius]|nr:hypothetical protein [Ligilactobacillus salivarius]
MFGIFFTYADTMTRYQYVMYCYVQRFTRFFHIRLDEVGYLAPSAFQAHFIPLSQSKQATH